MRNLRSLQVLNIAGLVLVLVMNTLANALPINGKTTGELSALYPNLFVPAGFTFSIWGLIYLLLILFVIYQARGLFDRQKSSPEVVAVTGPWFFLSCMANASWILAWHYTLVLLSLILMVVLFLSLLLLYLRIHAAVSTGRLAAAGKYTALVPFSIYFGWINVALIANFTAFLVSLDWRGGSISEPVWTALLIAAATVIGLLFLFRFRDIFFALVLCWAFFGIFASNNANPEGPIFIITLSLSSGFALLFIYLVARAGQWMKL